MEKMQFTTETGIKEIALRQELQKVGDQLLQLRDAGNELEFEAEALTITNEKDLEDGKKALIAIGGVKKKITAFIKPVKAAFKDLVDSFSKGATNADTILRGKINDYAAEQGRKHRAAEAAIQEQQKAAGVAAPVPVHLASPTDEGFRTYWKWRIKNEEIIPDEYWLRVLDKVKLDREVTNQQDQFHVPGIETYPEERVVAK